MPNLLERLTTALAERYAVESEVGRGGMATVFLAEDLKHGRKVAIKVLHPELASTVGGERFLREIDIAAGLDHPHILTLLDSGEADGLLYYVMPYVEGESLRSRLEREGQLPIDEAIRIAREVADGLGYAHRHGVVHRDIKPANIMLSEGHALIADFGVARAVGGEGQALTSTGLAVGTPAYMSPEQASGGKVDARSDLYALGCVLYEMLAGSAPLTGPTPQATAAMRLTETATPLPVIRETVPGGVEQVVGKLLTKSPADRYATAEKLVEALERPELWAEATPERRVWKRALSAAAIALIVIAIGAWWLLAGREARTGESGPASNTVAVLPFANIGGDDANAAFVDGIHNDILGQLAGISGVTPISRTSVMEYRNVQKSLREIAGELGAATVMEGSVQRAGGMVRVTVQVVDADTDIQLWGETYDRELTAENVFAIQAEISRNVATALAAELTAEERVRLETPLTDNLEAYDLYVKSFGYMDEVFEEQLAVGLLRQAVSLDPEFAAAWALLAGAYGQLAFKYRGQPEAVEYCDGARQAIGQALELDPNLPEVRYRAGWFEYRCTGNYKRALLEVEEAVNLAPDGGRYLEGRGLVLRRLGRFEDAAHTFERALELSPRYTDLDFHLTWTYREMRRFRDAEGHLEHALSLRPDNGVYFTIGLETHILEGDLGKARALLARAEKVGTEIGARAYFEALIDIWQGRYERALQTLDSTGHELFARYQWSRWPLLLKKQLKGEALWQAGDRQAAAVIYDSARVVLERSVEGTPDDAVFRSALGFTYARLGRREEAIQQGESAVALIPIERDALDGRVQLEHLARIYSAAGEHEAAIELLERLLAMPSAVNPRYLAIDPTWSPLREHPRFSGLLDTGE